MIGTIEVVFNYLFKFITVVLVNCFYTPENFKGCVKVDQWLFPYVEEYLPYVTGEREAYDTEREYLENINN